jgi:uncharacterized membrane protein
MLSTLVAAGVLPEGFALPPLVYLVVLLVTSGGVIALLGAIKPPISDWTPVAIVPWVVLGGTLHALYKSPVAGYPDWIRPFFGSPAVYATVTTLAGVVWIGSTWRAAALGGSSDRPLGVIGTGLAVTIAVLGIWAAIDIGELTPFYPTVILFSVPILTALIWVVLSLTYTTTAAITKKTGGVVIFGHVLDGISTAVGYDVIGVEEQVPISAAILRFGERFPYSETIGAGWLFVLVKTVLAIAIVVLFTEYVREAPRRGRLLLTLIAAIGLGPGMHNLMLFMLPA